MAFRERTADDDITELTNGCSLDFPNIESDENCDFDNLVNYLGGNDESDTELDVVSPPPRSTTSNSLPSAKTPGRPAKMAIYTPCGTGSSGTKARSLDSNAIIVPIPQNQPNGDLCMTKPAILARERRQKQKEYLQQLESTVKKLNQENAELKTEVGDLDKQIGRLNDEVKYLRSVIANESTLSALLTNVVNTPGLTFRGSLVGEKSRPSPDESRVNSSTEALEPRGVGAGDNGHVERNGKRSRARGQDENCEPTPPSKRTRKSVNSAGNSRDPGVMVVAAEEQVTTSPAPSSVSSSILVPQDFESNVSSQDRDVLETSVDKAGVCLHVNGKDVSFELCMACNKNASKNRALNDHDYTTQC